jgi:hypothetical protein
MFDVERILAIPDFDDRPQMGLSKAGLAVIVERGGITADGTKAHSSVLKRADIKGDKPLTPELATKVKAAIAGVKGGMLSKNKVNTINIDNKSYKVKIVLPKQGEKARVFTKNIATGKSVMDLMDKTQIPTHLSNLDKPKQMTQPTEPKKPAKKPLPKVTAKQSKATQKDIYKALNG